VIHTIDSLIPRHDYGKENAYLVFYHQVKPNQTKELKAEWFDYNHGEKVLWLLIRECPTQDGEEPKYRNVKLCNIDQFVQLNKRKNKKGNRKC